MKKFPFVGAMVATLLLSPVAAEAAPIQHPMYANTNITWNNNEVNSAKHLQVIDPWSGHLTSALPLYYVDEALGEITGLAASWDGTVRTLNITLPSSVPVNLSNLPPVQTTVKQGEMLFTINGTPVQYAPYFEAIDPASGKETSYVPIYYLEEVAKRFGAASAWNGTNLAFLYGQVPPVVANSPLATKMDLLETLGEYLLNMTPAQYDEYGGGNYTIPKNPGPDPYTDVTASEWPLVDLFSHSSMANNSFGIASPISATDWGTNRPITLTQANEFFAEWLGVTDTKSSLEQIPSGNINEYLEVTHVDTGLPTTGYLTVSDLNRMVANLKLITQGFEEVAPNEYEILPQPGNSPVLSIAGYEYTSQIRIRIDGDKLIASFPGLPDDTAAGAPWIEAVTRSERYSVNGGKTWAVAPPQGNGAFPGYSNVFSPYDSPSFTPKTVIMETNAESGFGIKGGYLAAGGVENSGFIDDFVCGTNSKGQFGVDFTPAF